MAAFLAAAVALTYVPDAEAARENVPDLRRLLSESKNRIFLARVADVAWRPGPVRHRFAADDAPLIEGIAYWLRAGQEYERREGVRLTSPDEVLGFIFSRYGAPSRYTGLDPQSWSSIALARAARGDLQGAVSMLETGYFVYASNSHAAVMANDAAALRIQLAVAQDDVRPMLDALVDLESSVHRSCRRRTSTGL